MPLWWQQRESVALWPITIFRSNLLENYDSPQIINVGCGYDITIRELALLIAKVVGVDAELVFDTSKPDGTPRKLLDISRLGQLGWQPRITLEDGVRDAYQWFLRHFGKGC
jgi:GDP-L-fucose synthase